MTLGVVTLLYSEGYLPGAFALGFQLQKILVQAESTRSCLLVTAELFHKQLTKATRDVLNKLYDEIVTIEELAHNSPVVHANQANLCMLDRPELAYTFMKAQVWKLTHFDRVLYLDSDVLPLGEGVLELFALTKGQTAGEVAAAADCGWPDMFNSGVMVVVPDNSVFEELSVFMGRELSIDGADQGILNQFFNPNCWFHGCDPKSRSWNRLPFIYNVTVPNTGYQSTPALKYFENQVKMVHFIGKDKPWYRRGSDQFRRRWWDIYNNFLCEYFPAPAGDRESSATAGTAFAFAQEGKKEAICAAQVGLDPGHAEGDVHGTTEYSRQPTENFPTETDDSAQAAVQAAASPCWDTTEAAPAWKRDIGPQTTVQEPAASVKGQDAVTPIQEPVSTQEPASTQQSTPASSTTPTPAPIPTLAPAPVEEPPVIPQNTWDPAKEPPPKDGKPEGINLVLDTEEDAYTWQEEAEPTINVFLMDKLPPPIFPWELERDEYPVERVFPE